MQLESKLRAMTLSPEAARWVMKALDPVRGGPSQIPDAIQVPTLVPEYKVTNVIGAPGVANWDCIIITPPSDRVGFYFATGPQGIDFSDTVASVNSNIVNTSYTVSPAGQLTGASVTNASGAWQTGVGGWRTTASSELPAMWRTSARSTTVYATGSELYNQGTVYAGQYARKSSQALARAVSLAGGQDVVVMCEAYALPLREQDMAVMTPGFYTASAKEGVYSVNRLTGPAQEFITPAVATQWMTTDGLATVHSTTDPTNKNCCVQSYPRIYNDSFWAVSPVVPPGLGPDAFSSGFDQGCTWGVTIFRGLHPQMSLTVKTVTCLEVVPTSAAPSRQFIKPPMKFEPTAIAAYYALASELPCCMAAKHNFLGSILPMISSIASKVLPFLAPALGQGLSALGGAVARKYTAPPTPAPTPRPAIRASSVASHSTRRSTVSRASKRSARPLGRRVRLQRRRK